MNYIRLTFAAFILLIVSSLSAQDADYVYEDRVYDDLIKSVQIYIDNQPAIVPFIGLNSGFRSFTFRFDELAEGANEFFYRVIHCDRNWKRSNLDEVEYLEGFNDEEIQSSEFSTNTFVDYVHYSLTLPNEDTQFRISGNYILIIYDDEAMTNPVISRRFMINEDTADLYTNFRQVHNVQISSTHHQLGIEADVSDLKIGNIMTDLSIDIIQNNRWDNRITNQAPKFIVKNRISFDNTGKLVIPAGKEFRQFDMRSLQYTSQFVKEIDLHDEGSDVLLVPDRKGVTRSGLDFDGRYVIYTHDFRNQNSSIQQDSLFRVQYNDLFSEDEIEQSMYRADYANVIFGLESTQMLEEIYLLGSFNDWRIDENFKLKFSEGNGYYINTILKQGVYNYLYAIKDVDGKPDFDLLEGDDRRTRNYYTTILYQTDFIDQYDRIISVNQVLSSEQFYNIR